MGLGFGVGCELCCLTELLATGTFPLSRFGHSWDFLHDFLHLPWMNPVLMQPELH